MGYKYAPITVDLSEFGEGLFAKCVHPKLQPNAVYKAQQRTMVKLAEAIPPELLDQTIDGNLDTDKLTTAQKIKLAPVMLDQEAAKEELLAELLIDWNVPDIYTGEVLKVPRLAKEGREVFKRVPGGILGVIYEQVRAAEEGTPDPNS